MSEAALEPRATAAGWRRLHPLSVAVNLVPRTWVLLRQVWPVLVGWFLLGQVSGQAVADLGVLLLFLSPAIVGTVSHWALLRYRTTDDHLVVETGWMNRQTRTIAVDRVQNVELVRNVFHRLFGLVEVRVETASGKEVEGLLSALSEEEAERLLVFLERGRAARAAPSAAASAAPPVVETSPLELLWYGATGTRLASVAVLTGFVYEIAIVPATSDPAQLGSARALGAQLAPVLLVAVVTGAWWLGVGGALARFYGYRLARDGDALVSEQGLFTRRAARLGLSKIQLVVHVEPMVRRLAGFGSLTIETASARQEGDGLERAETLVPYVGRDEVVPVLRAALPDAPDPSEVPLRPPHPFAIRRALARAGLGTLLGVGLGALALGELALVGLALVPLALASAWLDVRSQGFALASGLVLARRGFWSRKTTLLPMRKVQSVDLHQGPWLRRRGLAELSVRVAGGRVTLPLQELDEAVRVRGEILSLAR